MPDTIGDRDRNEAWLINDGIGFVDNVEEIRTFDALELSGHTTLEAVRETLRPLRENAGSFDIRDRSDGGFVAIDTADGDNTHTISAPDDRRPLRMQKKWLVADYDEEMLDTQGERYEVELELIPQESKRQYSGLSDEERDPEVHWLFEFEAADMATPAVSAEILESHSDGVEAVGLDMELYQPQVRKLEESCRRLAAVDVVEQFDGGNRAKDQSPGEVNTVWMEPPEGGDKTVDPGWYVVEDYEVEWTDELFYHVDVELLKLERDPPLDPDFVDEEFGSDEQLRV